MSYSLTYPVYQCLSRMHVCHYFVLPVKYAAALSDTVSCISCWSDQTPYTPYNMSLRACLLALFAQLFIHSFWQVDASFHLSVTLPFQYGILEDFPFPLRDTVWLELQFIILTATPLAMMWCPPPPLPTLATSPPHLPPPPALHTL